MNATPENTSEVTLPLANAPIIEAVVEIDCDMPPGLDFVSLEKPARERLSDAYPKFRTQFVQQHEFKLENDAPPELSVSQGVQALQFLKLDGRQLVQIKQSGFAFNRLTPYSSLDNYLPEIERTWRLFAELAGPVQVRKVGLRYINRLLLPFDINGRLEFNDYFRISPQLPDEARLQFVGFFNQHNAVEVATGNLVNIALVTQGKEEDKFAVIFDIEAVDMKPVEPGDWPGISEKIASLRDLKNDVFRKTLTDQCLNLFR